jgi:hypothetical protein
MRDNTAVKTRALPAFADETRLGAAVRELARRYAVVAAGTPGRARRHIDERDGTWTITGLTSTSGASSWREAANGVG